ncbi:hypothetical protein LPY66_08350 [Dehalobacter sp. DCM]|uniref:hypothetical protein n=1 Tax=Dehalobacter sp. DCM TaxID=2907827 RepID=UPI0030814C22|nr:hypothetical protein LPY66_08350 [Dehalobacter sp. DCM]
MSRSEKADGVETAGKQYGYIRIGEDITTSPGSKSQACCTMITPQPGRPCQLFFKEVWQTTLTKKNAKRLAGSRMAE